MRRLTRRQFLHQAGAVAVGFAALELHAHGGERAAPELVSDPQGVLDLAPGFAYRAFGRAGETMSDGYVVPGAHDGMGAFPGPEGRVILVRNHELTDVWARGPFAAREAGSTGLSVEQLYDAGRGAAVPCGGTTTLVYAARRGRLERQFLSLAGTVRNCAGGVTPWGSWITCEETFQGPDDRRRRKHGYCFEVPAQSQGLVEPQPLTAMGRFNHEAVAVDDRTGAVYLTEDRGDGLFYRFLPERPGELAAGGRLQALRLRDAPQADPRNQNGEARFPLREPQSVQWVDLDQPDPPADDLRRRGFEERGAARFARGEGIWMGADAVYFACTSGGPQRRGQIFRYVPSPEEGRSGETEQPGTLELFLEAGAASRFERPDNLCVAPNGDLWICEDSDGRDHLVRVDRRGRAEVVARNALNDAELAGVCFSPDGATLFVNIQHPGLTLALSLPPELRATG